MSTRSGKSYIPLNSRNRSRSLSPDTRPAPLSKSRTLVDLARPIPRAPATTHQTPSLLRPTIPPPPSPPPIHKSFPYFKTTPPVPRSEMATSSNILKNMPLNIPTTPSQTPVHLTKMRTFYGYHPSEDAVRWFQDFTAQANHARWTKMERCNSIILHLDGTARDWYYAIPPAEQGDYDAMVESFANKFGPNSSEMSDRDDDWENLSQGTDIAAKFAHRASALGDSLGKPESEVKSKFINGLNVDIRLEVYRKGAKDLPEAIQAANHAESFLNKISKQRVPVHTIESYTTPNPEIELLKREVALLRTELRGVGKPVCNFCKKPGHTEFVCYSKKSNTPRDRSARPTMVCNYCNNPGHAYQDCRNRRRDQSQNNYRPQQNQQPPRQYASNPPPVDAMDGYHDQYISHPPPSYPPNPHYHLPMNPSAPSYNPQTPQYQNPQDDSYQSKNE